MNVRIVLYYAQYDFNQKEDLQPPICRENLALSDLLSYNPDPSTPSFWAFT